MLKSDDVWEKIRPHMNANENAVFTNLRIYTEKEYQLTNSLTTN